MCVTQEMQGKIELKGSDSRAKLAQELNPERGEQYLPGWKRDVTWVSRLQCTQAAVDGQLKGLSKSSPNDKVGLITFSNEVTVYGDATQPAEVLAGNHLFDVEKQKQLGESFKVKENIEESEKALSAKLWGLEESGATALGPALVVGVGMAGQARGSKVILCTDGLANVGSGSLEFLETEEDCDVATSFYSNIAEYLFSFLSFLSWAISSPPFPIFRYAKSLGVEISVVTMEGTHCSIENIGMLAEKTGGNVDIVNPVELAKNFHTILEETAIATNVLLKLVMHNNLFLRSIFILFCFLKKKKIFCSLFSLGSKEKGTAQPKRSETQQKGPK